MLVTLTITPIAVNENVDQLKVAELSVGTEVGCTFEFQNAELYAIFDIVGSEVFLKEGVTLDFETAQSSIQINVIKDSAVVGSEVFTPIVIDENDVPTNVSIDGTSIAEGATAGDVVGTLMASDQDNDSLSYVITNSLGEPVTDLLFDVSADADGNWRIVVKANVTLSDANVGNYDLYVAANDGTGLSDPLKVTIAITDVNNLPTNVSIDGTSIVEGATAGDVVGTLMASDQDNDSLSYVITNSLGEPVTDLLFDVSADADGNWRIVVKANVTLSDANVGNYDLYVAADDGTGLSDPLKVTIAITDVPDNVNPPVVTTPTTARNVADTDLVSPFADATFEDLDGGNLKVSITIDDLTKGVLGNLGAGTFTAATGTYVIEGTAAEVTAAVRALTFNPTDRANAAVGATEITTFTVKVEDGDATHTPEDTTVTVTSVAANRAPSDVSLAGASVQELAANGTVVGSLGSTDSNAGDKVSYTLSDDAGGRFAILDGKIIVKDGLKLDFEQAMSHEIKVKATDAGGLSVEKILKISLTDLASETITGTAAIDVFVGGAGKDNISGGLGDDRLAGGFGNDILTGGKGKDTFVFDTRTSKTANLDRIVDFSVKDDSIYLDNAIFKKLGKGTPEKPQPLNKKFFTIGTKAKDKNDYLIYDNKKGVIFYDADGSGKGKAVEIIKIGTKLALKNTDFFVV